MGAREVVVGAESVFMEAADKLKLCILTIETDGHRR